MHQPQDGIVQFFTADHRHCDDLWAAFEKSCDSEPEGASTAWKLFESATLQHFSMEEEFLFPEFEKQTGIVGGPTEMMRLEHAKIRNMLQLIATCVQSGELEEALDQGDTLLLFTQQHNQKEEAMLYPMAERVLQGSWPQLAEKLVIKA